LVTFASAAERKEVLDYFSGRFGIPEEAFEGFCLLKGEKKIWVVRDHPDLEGILKQLKIESAGIPLLRTKKSMWKPTTAGLQVFGAYATRNGIDLEGDALHDFLKGESLEGPFPLDPGFVIVRWNGKVLACGAYGKGKLRSQIPEPRGRGLRRKNGAGDS
jgi:NOL1/NOP2/fmu family ribosome biogenesis protein